MSPLALKILPYAVIVVLLLLLAGITDAYLKERDQLTALTASVKTLGEAAEEALKKKEQEGIDNLTTIKAKYEKEIPTVRRDAVANYRLRNPSAGSCPMPGNAPGKQVDDGEKPELVLDEPFISECAADASKLAAWQEYCTLNHCPVKD